MTTDSEAPSAENNPRVRVDYGLRFDCAANGCDKPCSDDAEVLPRGNAQPVIERVNGHAVTAVQRTVTYSPWTRVIPPTRSHS